jgi:hypothetical protein
MRTASVFWLGRPGFRSQAGLKTRPACRWYVNEIGSYHSGYFQDKESAIRIAKALIDMLIQDKVAGVSNKAADRLNIRLPRLLGSGGADPYLGR